VINFVKFASLLYNTSTGLSQ